MSGEDWEVFKPMEYPKINSLYKREGCGIYNEEKHRYECDLEKKPRKSALIIGDYACEEFTNVNRWTVTEKVDGTNVRIFFTRENGTPKLQFLGRTDNSQFPTTLLSYLQETFPIEKMDAQFKDASYVILFGEGYGPKIQNGGYYRKDVGFALFDVYINGWWLERTAVREIAMLLGIPHAVHLIHKDILGLYNAFWEIDEIVEYVKKKHFSMMTENETYKEPHVMEGIVARSEPLMLFRNKLPVMFKLKCKDFE